MLKCDFSRGSAPVPNEACVNAFCGPGGNQEPTGEDPEARVLTPGRSIIEDQTISMEFTLESLTSGCDTSGGFDTKDSNGVTIHITGADAGIRMRHLERRELEILGLIRTPVEKYAPRIFLKPQTGSEAGWAFMASDPTRMGAHIWAKKVGAGPGVKPPPLSHKPA
mmetsp:Transcript_4478/g.10923  ORF Transcript_4478/g.10923 Transcript_4478/m.10923 type:complete len:166 (+) Transcript_4478:518-1015(+)